MVERDSGNIWGHTDADDACRLLWRVVEDALPHIIVQMRTVVVCFHGITLGFMGICVEGVEMCANSLDGCEVLPPISVCKSLEVDVNITCTAPAPVSSVLLVTLSGSPTVLLLTGSESMV